MRNASPYDRYHSTHAQSFSFEEGGFERRIEYFNRRLKGLLPADPGAPILDIACGRGEFLALLNRLGYSNATGVDVSEEQVAIAQGHRIERVSHEDFTQYLVTHDTKYELMLASHVIEHLEHDEVLPALRLVASRLSQTGRLVVIVPNAASAIGLPYAFGDFTHRTFWSASSLAQAARMANLAVLDIRGVPPDASTLRGAVRAVIWALAGWLLRPLSGDRFMRYRVLEPEILAVFAATTVES
jgi:2-polyprenyl-3-methyl-5-hydroxy-6-metoxy-1,4-benzoquinol methylase